MNTARDNFAVVLAAVVLRFRVQVARRRLLRLQRVFEKFVRAPANGRRRNLVQHARFEAATETQKSAQPVHGRDRVQQARYFNLQQRNINRRADLQRYANRIDTHLPLLRVQQRFTNVERGG